MPRMGGSAVAIRLELVKLAKQGGVERAGVVPAVQGERADRVQVDEAVRERGRGGTSRPLASAASPAAAQQRGTRAASAGTAPQVSGVGATQAAQAVEPCGVSTAAQREHRQRRPEAPQPAGDRSTARACSAPQRFEYAAPNELWQMDFKGHFALHHGRCHPLTVLDDHSRFAVGLRRLRQ